MNNIYRFPEPRSTRNLLLTQPSSLYFYANDYFIYLLLHYFSLLSYYSFILS